jgi:hypothetical protein
LADEFFHFEGKQRRGDCVTREGTALDDCVDVDFVVADGGVDLRFMAGECRTACGSEVGFFGKENSNVVEDVYGGSDEFGSLLDEAV